MKTNPCSCVIHFNLNSLPLIEALSGNPYMYSIHKFLLLFLVFVPELTSAKESHSIGVGIFNEPSGERYGAELFISARGDYFGGRLSGVYYASTSISTNKVETYTESTDIFGNVIYAGTIESTQDIENNEEYGGFSVFAFIHADQLINPYLGLGMFVGRPFHCSSEKEELETCHEDAEVAFYPEFGVEVNIYNVRITPYIRRYYDTSTSNKSENVYGINFSIH